MTGKYEVPLVKEVCRAIRDGMYTWEEMGAIKQDCWVAMQEMADAEMGPTRYEKHEREEF